MTLSSETRVRLGFAVLALLVVLSGCSYNPPDVCGVCGEKVGVAAEKYGVNVTVASSEVHVYLREDGSARWVDRTEFDGVGVNQLRENATLRNRVLQQVIEYSADSAAPKAADRIEFEGDTLIATYEVPQMADTYPGGVLVVDRFQQQRYGNRMGYEVLSDRVVLHAPDGMVVANEAPSTRQTPDAVVWQYNIPSETYVAFGPDRSRFTVWAAQMAIAIEVARWAAVDFAAASLVSVVTLGLVAGLLLEAYGTDAFDGTRSSGLELDADLAKPLAFVALVFAAVAVFVVVTVTESAAPAFWLLTGFAVVFFAALVPAADRPWQVRLPVAAALVGTGPLVALLAVLDSPGQAAAYVTVIWSIGVCAVGVPIFGLLRLISTTDE